MGSEMCIRDSFITIESNLKQLELLPVFLSDKLKPLQKSVGTFATLDFRNFGSLAVGQTEVPRLINGPSIA